MIIDVDVAANLRMPDYLLEYIDICEEIYNSLTIPNKEKQIAIKLNRWKAHELPDEFYLYDIDSDNLLLPRGYALKLKLLLRDYGHEVRWQDHRRSERGKPFRWREKFIPRPHQIEAVDDIRRHQQGLYEAPTGSGKTLACIKFIHDISPRKTLILVDQLGLLNQWIKEIDKWLGDKNVGQIGAGTWDDSQRISVATVQTLWSEIKELEHDESKIDYDWFKQFDCVIVDECHHVPATTIRDIVNRFSARWRFGVSATPDRKDGKFEFVLNILGELFRQEDEEILRKSGILVKPVVEIVKTDFKFAYWGDHEAEYDEELDRWFCQKLGCGIDGPHKHKNNYHKLKSALVSDINRNKLVVRKLMAQVRDGYHTHLIVSNEIRQLDAIESVLINNSWRRYTRQIPIYRLTGKERGNKRKNILAQIERDEESIILATVAKEGLDIPKLDRLYLPFPNSSAAVTKQVVGRAARIFEGKKDAIIFDLVDYNVDLLRRQFGKRCHGFYYKSNIKVIR